MKRQSQTNRVVVIATLIILLTIGMMIGCAQKESKQDVAKLFSGAWGATFTERNVDYHEYRFNKGSFESFDGTVVWAKGTYLIEGEEVTFTTTDLYTRTPENADEKRWYTKDEYAVDHADRLTLLASMQPDRLDIIHDLFHVGTYHFSFTGDDLLLSYPIEIDMEMTGLTYEELVEKDKDQDCISYTPGLVTTKYTKVK